MTQQQRNKLIRVCAFINDIRSTLDDVMYRSEPLTDEEHGKVRECYDNLCEVTDKLYRI